MIVFAGLTVFLTLLPLFLFWRMITAWLISQGGEAALWGEGMAAIFS